MGLDCDLTTLVEEIQDVKCFEIVISIPSHQGMIILDSDKLSIDLQQKVIRQIIKNVAYLSY